MENELAIDADVANLIKIRDFVQKWALGHQANPSAVDSLILAVDETASNVIVHGYQGEPGMIEIALAAEGEDLVVRVRDHAPRFDPTSVAPPDLSLPLEKRVDGGLGVFLARRSVDSITYRVTETGQNELTLRKKKR